MAELKIELPAPVSGRLPVLDELKGLAIILVILYHAGGVLVWNNYLHGDIGVDMFVILSGLGLALGSHYKDARTFLARRYLRLMPAYWVILTLYVVCNQHFLQHDYSVLNLTVHYLGIHALLGDAWGLAINYSFWFISAILGFYLCYCPLHHLLDRPDRFLFWSALLSTGVALLLFFTGQAGLMGLLGFRMGGFFLGMLLGHVLKTGRLVLPLNTRLAWAFLIFSYVPYTCGITFVSALVALALMAAYVLAIRPRLPGPVGPPVTSGLAFLGVHSLEIFLIHQPLMREYNYYLHGRWFNVIRPSPFSLIVGMVIALAVTLLLSVELRRLLQKLPFPAKA